jgi:hypothetical protein
VISVILKRRVSLTEKVISGTPAKMGRKKRYSDEMLGRYEAGTLQRITAVLREGENMRDFVRLAVESALNVRETLAGSGTRTTTPPNGDKD